MTYGYACPASAPRDCPPIHTVSVAYPTRWANPFRPVTRSPAANDEAIRQYCRYLQQRPDLVAAARAELAGRNLAC